MDAEHLSATLTLVGHAFGNRIARAFASPPPPRAQNAAFKAMLGLWPESIGLSALQEALLPEQLPTVSELLLRHLAGR